MPVTKPEVPTDAIDKSPLLHMPPRVISLNAVVAAIHTLLVPEIAAGVAPTVTIEIMRHAVAKV
jgi:hypothetical protein